MIPFDIEKLSVQHIKMKSITTALGGSMIILDEAASTDDKEVFKRIPVPMAEARMFIKVHKVSKFIKPVEVAITVYDGHVAALELRRLTKDEVVDEMNCWISNSEQNIKHFLRPLVQGEEWLTDGSFVYQYATGEEHLLTKDGKFRSVPVNAIKLADVGIEVNVSERTCLAYVPSSGDRAVSPPIWKELSTVGTRQLKRAEDDSEEDGAVADFSDYQFDRVDEFLIVNLGFALKAAKELSDVFGYDSIEPLALDDLMIRMKTVNLPKVQKEIKRTYNIGMKFTHALAWLLGMTMRTESLDSYRVLRSLMKYLTTKGVYRMTALNTKAIYRDGMSQEDVPLRTLADALDIGQNAGSFTTYVSGRAKEVSTIGNLYGAE